jgi:hypothetical protein
VLADMTADQPPARPNRFGTVRRRAVLHRRRQLAGPAAAVAILAATAIAIPLGLLRIGPQPPAGPARHYHVSQHQPGPGAERGLIAYGVAAGVPWRLVIRQEAGDMICWIIGSGTSCGSGPPAPASRSGPPLTLAGSEGLTWQLDVGTVRSDVAYVTVGYNNGQVLKVYPIALFARRYARYIGFASPFGAAVTGIAAYSAHGQLAYTVPFTADGSITIERWLQPGQPALPPAVTHRIGSGTVNGSAWRQSVYLGPWGTCVSGSGGGTVCNEDTSWHPAAGQFVRQLASAGLYGTYSVVSGEAGPQAACIIVSTPAGQTTRVPVVTVGARKFWAYASLRRGPVTRWAAYDSAGHELASGSAQG